MYGHGGTPWCTNIQVWTNSKAPIQLNRLDNLVDINKLGFYINTRSDLGLDASEVQVHKKKLPRTGNRKCFNSRRISELCFDDGLNATFFYSEAFLVVVASWEASVSPVSHIIYQILTAILSISAYLEPVLSIKTFLEQYRLSARIINLSLNLVAMNSNLLYIETVVSIFSHSPFLPM
ncbi:hypothetical protein AMATHDRAFT_48294 [Amanita thiersii Skay4041]|uniref:Uncharacterized protein n=1 Tax=Amanita thiersii Skay4041 TaxID=703135 RepID=A0A2A9NG26_9AGAR|nr:hypothetical protein AMATHDRAFT_48294 [Amanita thiersii Skay4041]